MRFSGVIQVCKGGHSGSFVPRRKQRYIVMYPIRGVEGRIEIKLVRVCSVVVSLILQLIALLCQIRIFALQNS